MQQEVRGVFARAVKQYGQGWLGGLLNPLLQPNAALDQRTAQWHKERNRFWVTCSTIAQAIGIGYQSRIKLYEEKVLGKKKPIEGIVQGWIDYGVEHEIDGLLQYVKFKKPQEDGFILTCGTFVSGLYDFSGSPDGIWINKNTLEATLLEVKVPNPDMGSIPDEVPPMYLTQIIGLMSILHIEKCHFIYWTKSQVRIFEIKHNQEVFEMIVPYMQEFMECCSFGKPPGNLPRGRKKIITDILDKLDQRIIAEFVPQ